MKRVCAVATAATCLVIARIEALPQAVSRPATNRDYIAAFEQRPTEWVAGFQSPADWKGERGFSPRSRETDQTGRGWFCVGGKDPYQGVRAPKGFDYAVCESQFNADHTQLTGPEARTAVKADEAFDPITGSYDLIVAFQDDGTERTRSVLNGFFQIFELTKEQGWRPAYALFFKNEQLLAGAWDDNPAVPGVTLRRGQWYRIRFDLELRHGGARTVLSVWPVDENGRQGAPQVSALVIDHQKGLVRSGLARRFPVMAGSYTWQVPGRESYSAATLICAYSQSQNSTSERVRQSRIP